MVKIIQPDFHFLLVNIFGWRSGNDLHPLMKEMDKEKTDYWVWYVPGDSKSVYDISFYCPQVEGSFILAEVTKGKKK